MRQRPCKDCGKPCYGSTCWVCRRIREAKVGNGVVYTPRLDSVHNPTFLERAMMDRAGQAGESLLGGLRLISRWQRGDSTPPGVCRCGRRAVFRSGCCARCEAV